MSDKSERIAVDTTELMNLLSCGRNMAIKVGVKAGARIKLGKKVVWNVMKIREYISSISEGE